MSKNDQVLKNWWKILQLLDRGWNPLIGGRLSNKFAAPGRVVEGFKCVFRKYLKTFKINIWLWKAQLWNLLVSIFARLADTNSDRSVAEIRCQVELVSCDLTRVFSSKLKPSVSYHDFLRAHISLVALMAPAHPHKLAVARLEWQRPVIRSMGSLGKCNISTTSCKPSSLIICSKAWHSHCREKNSLCLEPRKKSSKWVLLFFCSTRLPLAITRWVWSTLSGLFLLF